MGSKQDQMEKVQQLAVGTHVLVVLMAVSIPVIIFNGSLFSWHPSLMAVGFLGFMTEGILTSITFRHLEGNERVSKIWQHLSWQIVSLVCIIAGFLTIFQNKVNNDKAHFTTLHAKFGVSTFAVALAVAVGGAIGFKRFGILTKLPEQLHPIVKATHRNAGLVVWLFALFTIELALVHHSVWKGFLSVVWEIGVVVLALLALFIWWLGPASSHKYEQHVDQQMAERI